LDKRVAGGLTILEGIWGFYLHLESPTVSGLPCPSSGCPPQFPAIIPEAELALVVVLLLAGFIGAWGARFAFYGGALSSVAFLLVAGYSAWLWGGLLYGGVVSWIGVGLSVIAIAANVLALRGKNRMSEQGNPMNLPVFG
jgi:hypothetical protein